MNKSILLVLPCSLMLLSCALAPSTVIDASVPIKAFEAGAVKNYVNFFKTNPILVNKESYSSSPTGLSTHVTRFNYVSSSYDVQKSDSLVSPFTGKIEITASASKNASCGDLELVGKTPIGFSSEVNALNKKDDEACFKNPFTRQFIIDFVYQNEKWMFKGVRNKDSDIAPIDITAAFGVPSNSASQPMATQQGKDVNKKWSDLAQEDL
jgi:hypothetical protein